MSGRRFTDQEIALILRRATELQDGSGRGGHTADHGMALETLQEIAREIGVEPQYVEQAVLTLSDRTDSPAARLIGGAPRTNFRERIPAALSEADLHTLLAAMRRTMKHNGEAREVMGGLEWKTVDNANQLLVTVSPEDDGTVVHVAADQTATATLSWIGVLLAAFTAGGLVVESLQPGLFGVIGILSGSGALGAVAARAVWSRLSRGFRRRLDRLHAEIRKFAPSRPDESD